MKTYNIKILGFLIIIFSLFSCDKVAVKSGKINIEIFIYEEASSNDNYLTRFPISTLYFNNKKFIEILPYYSDNFTNLPFVAIKDNKFVRFKKLDSIQINEITEPIDKKTVGVKFINDNIKDFDKREKMTDTVFNNYNYSRYKIASKEEYAVFYIHKTDSVYPFSLSPQFDHEGKGILNRIDTYEIKEDRFTSLRMSISDTIPKNIYKQLLKL